LALEFVRRAEERSVEMAKRMEKVNAISELCGSMKLANELLEMTRGQSKYVVTTDRSALMSGRYWTDILRGQPARSEQNRYGECVPRTVAKRFAPP